MNFAAFLCAGLMLQLCVAAGGSSLRAQGTGMSDLPSTEATKRTLDPTSLPRTCHRFSARTAMGGQKHPQQNHDSEIDNSLHAAEERELENIDMPPHINNMPFTILSMTSELLIVKDLLTLRTVNRNLRELSKDERLWKKLACFLWTSALVDAKSSSLADESSAHLHQDAPCKWCVLWAVAKDP